MKEKEKGGRGGKKGDSYRKGRGRVVGESERRR